LKRVQNGKKIKEKKINLFFGVLKNLLTFATRLENGK
jgi:hypothetical protein